MMSLFHFGAKRKTLSPSVMLQYKPEIKDFLHLINKNENPCSFMQRSKKWKSTFVNSRAYFSYNYSIIQSESIWTLYAV